MSAYTIGTARTAWHEIDYLPVSLFGAVMGLTGLIIAWRLAHEAYGVSAAIPEAIGWTAVGASTLTALGYL